MCKNDIRKIWNHPNYVCKDCVYKYPILNGRGEEVEFSNVDISGGFVCRIKATGETNEDHVCYINNVRCWADEFRFGGIVIETITNDEMLSKLVGRRMR